MHIEQSIRRIRAFKQAMGWSTLRLAHEANMNESALRKIDRDDWNPETKTLRRLEQIIPDDFRASEEAA